MNVHYPVADVLAFAGDILGNYSWDKRADAKLQLHELVKFNERMGELKRAGIYQEIVVVGGNHDKCFDQVLPECMDILKNARYLQDEAAEILGRKFYGSPWQPWFGGHVWSFNFPPHKYEDGGNPAQARAHARRCWARIPDDTEVLITHSPPHGTRDMVDRGEMVGCPELAAKVQTLPNLKLHVFGHIHHGRGQTVRKFGDREVRFVNTAMVTDQLDPQGDPFVVEI